MGRWLSFIVISFMLGGFAAPAAADDRGTCFDANSAPDAAITACDRFIAPGGAAGRDLMLAHTWRGFAYRKKGDYDRAIRDFDEAIRLEPTAAGHSNRGVAYRLKGEYDRAIRDYDEALRLDPKYAAAFINRGFVHNAKGDYDRAVRDFDEAIRLDPKSVDAHTYRGHAYAFKGDYDRAIGDYNEGIRLDPRNVTAHSGRGFAYNNKGEYGRAIADLDEAIRLEPKFPNAYSHRGFAYGKKGEYDRAMVDLNKALELNPQYARGYTNRGLIHEARGELGPALADLRTALSLDPKLITAGREAVEGVQRIAQKLAAAGVKPETVTPSIPPAATALPADAGRRVALVIGNGAYRHAAALPNPGNDAADIAQALRELAFEVIEGRDLDWAGIRAKVKEFDSKLDNASLALFFYAGHGVQVDGRNYLVPVDAKLDRAGTLDQDAFDLLSVLRPMEADKRISLVFLDACRDNPFTRSLARSLGASRSSAVGTGLAPIQKASGTLITYATEPGNVAADGEGRNSPFTAALLKHIRKPGIEIEQMMKLVRMDVLAATRQKQLPKTDSGLPVEVFLRRAAQ